MASTNNIFKQSLSELQQEDKGVEFDFFQEQKDDGEGFQFKSNADNNASYLLSEKNDDAKTQKIIKEEIIIDKNPSQSSGQPKEASKRSNWMDESFNGKLAVDVFQTNDSLVIQSTIAGCEADDIDISINNEVITIRGMRLRDEELPEENYFYQECYWGGFSRSIILPMEVDPAGCEASMKNGILTISLPKRITDVTTIPVQNLDEDDEEEIM